MKTPLEEQLRSWTPRAPSQKLKTRLFAPSAAAGATAIAEEPIRPAAWHWMAPAMAVFLFGMFITGGRNPGALSPAPSLLPQFALAEPERTPYYAAAHHSDNNAVQFMTFDWTNSGHSLTTTVPMAPTNSLFQ